MNGCSAGCSAPSLRPNRSPLKVFSSTLRLSPATAALGSPVAVDVGVSVDKGTSVSVGVTGDGVEAGMDVGVGMCVGVGFGRKVGEAPGNESTRDEVGSGLRSVHASALNVAMISRPKQIHLKMVGPAIRFN